MPKGDNFWYSLHIYKVVLKIEIKTTESVPINDTQIQIKY